MLLIIILQKSMVYDCSKWIKHQVSKYVVIYILTG
uniref:Uncharacterized protein n=1 Tax=Arundo donax TaxID=35708 RepID=A0A0A8Y386_ARUDO